MHRSKCPITTFQSIVVCSLTGPLQHLNSFFFFFQSFCCRFAGVLDPFHNQALAVGHTVSYLTLELFDVQRNSQSSQ